MIGKSGPVADSVLLLDVLRGVLDRCGGQRWFVQPEEAWCSAAPAARVSRKHGWKLHVSATPLSAPIVLARAAEALVRNGCPFKFATDIGRVLELVDHLQNRGAGGKFITVYPRDDEQLLAVADELDRVTADLVGPRILSDRPLRPGSLVHYRYGEFTGEPVFTDDGVFESRMVGPDGSVVKDERRAWFSPPEWAVSPFPEPAVAPRAPGAAMVLAGRFRVTGAIRHANKGGVYQAIDDRSGANVVVKQARAHVGAALDGRDARDMLRHEAHILEALASLSLFPAFVALFEEQGDLFLAEEEIPGVTSDDWASEGGDVLGVAGRLVEAVRAVHEAGFVLCDLKPSNVIVTPDGGVRLIDAELVHRTGESVRGRTIGFAAPERWGDRSARRGVRPSADCFSLGVTLFCLASGGLAPHWVAGQPSSPRSGAERRRVLRRIAADRTGLVPLVELIAGLTETEPDQRWSLDRAERFLASPAARAEAPSSGVLMPSNGLDRMLADGLEHLQRGMVPDGAELWPASRAAQRHDPCDAWRGAAGGLATLTRAAQVMDDPALRASVARAAGWIDERLFDIPRILPGLCFGRAGTAWALHEAGSLLDDAGLTSRARRLAERLPTRGKNPEVAYGLSGAGLARLHLWRSTGDRSLLRGALDCAESVLAAADHSGEDVLWPVAVDDDQHSSYGFAHGVAGIGMFLLAAGQAAADGSDDRAERFTGAALKAGETLLRSASLREGAADWPTAVGGDGFATGTARWQWCNGPAGIGTFLIRLWSATGLQRFADVAVQCAVTASERWSLSVGACCGLAGSGHYLLDLADLTGDTGYRAQAEQVADVIHAQAFTDDGLLVPCHPDLGHAYAAGTAGVLDFLLRLRHGGPRPWLPETARPGGARPSAAHAGAVTR
ncbi:class IV lanthionine synthetase LanL [Actinomadura fibrosa]|uniref:non-specific serine/threonine protein kinase n=1 Tax=Actinomadura fibrosa TaxID=111802 RepID=A0ABW2XNI6_9ACTN|nr:class IV lanthionine synthetase LanL [Actinomadura fibrosa]